MLQNVPHGFIVPNFVVPSSLHYFWFYRTSGVEQIWPLDNGYDEPNGGFFDNFLMLFFKPKSEIILKRFRFCDNKRDRRVKYKGQRQMRWMIVPALRTKKNTGCHTTWSDR